MTHKVTLIPGDGIGPQVVKASVRILEATGVKFEWESFAAGAEAFEKYHEYIPKELTESIVQPVATYVDDTPLFFNLRLQDLDHVEILRGPQGTLYGSGSLGGTIRYVQNAPDLQDFDARVETGVSDTAHTHTVNWDVNGMLNLPIAETLALRLNAGYTEEAGFINQPQLYVLGSTGAPASTQPGNLLSPPQTREQNGVNSNLYRTARAALLWKPGDDFHAQLSYYHQQSSADGYPYAAPVYGLGALSSSDYVPATTNDTVDLAALTLEFELGFATLTSNSSWADHKNATVGDVTSLYDSFPFYSLLYGANPRVLVVGHQGFDDKPWAQEIRLASKGNETTSGWSAPSTRPSRPTSRRTTSIRVIWIISTPAYRFTAPAAA